MASSDEEGELIPDCVTDYYFVDNKDEIISFSDLPLTWGDDVIHDCSNTQIFLRGRADNGLQVLYKKVISWKFELSYVVPEFYVLLKDKTWIKLQQPRKGFSNIIKNSLVTVHCLHYIKRNPEASRDDMWNYLHKTLSSLESDPSESDLLVHKPLITEAINRDKDIAKSEYLAALHLDMREESTSLHEDSQTTKKSDFVVDQSSYDSENDGDNGNESDEDMLFDSVCSFCDNGGDILCCEGRCMRSFHPTEEAGVDTQCASLGYTDDQVEAMKTFLCKNCQYQQHQCFACGSLGSSDISSNPEVFPCVSATCGRFYHSKCVSKLLHRGDNLQADEVEKKIADGDSFVCPVHTCFMCKQGEDRKNHDLQFAVCRRCPKAYHRKCLPRTIAFEEDEYKGIQQRAWDDLLPKRILIYCMDHKMNEELGTPERDHIIFPGVDGKQQHRATKMFVKKKVGENYLSRSVTERGSMQLPLKSKKAEVTDLGGYSSKKVENIFPVKNSRMASNMHSQGAAAKPSTVPKKQSYLRNDEPAPNLRYKINLSGGKIKKMAAVPPMTGKSGSSISLVEAETEKRMLALIKHSTASFDEKEFIKKQKILYGNSCSMSYIVEKTMTMGKVEVSMKAVQAALRKLEGGCTIEEAKTVCEPQVLKQIFKWRNNLSFYLAPFLHGLRYTSFGRHFTKVDKLKEIVDRLHWYVQEGDMIVDFCCGSNDFSCFLKEKLQQTGKSCFFKNYDLIQSKNDFNFEKRDWMTVHPDELPEGSQLIMGLNPPFGIQGVQAYKFIKKALSFKPKLLILIVPRETRRPNADNSPYDLIWEDDSMLAGKSFYLPGSVDVHDQQLEQWNWQAPPLYLWSRKDWTRKHRKIALHHSHIYDNNSSYVEREKAEPAVSNYLMEEKQDCFRDFSHIVHDCGDFSRILDDVPEYSGYSEGEESRGSTAHKNAQIYDQNSNYNYYDPKNINVEENGNPGGGYDLETGEFCVDMELSTPTNSP